MEDNDTFIWEWQDSDNSWVTYDNETSSILNNHYQNSQSQCTLSHGKFSSKPYTIDFKNMTQRRYQKGKTTRSIRCLKSSETRPFAQWAWKTSNAWQLFEPKHMNLIEEAFSIHCPVLYIQMPDTGPIGKVKEYKIDFQYMKQRNIESGYERDLRRTVSVHVNLPVTSYKIPETRPLKRSYVVNPCKCSITLTVHKARNLNVRFPFIELETTLCNMTWATPTYKNPLNSKVPTWDESVKFDFITISMQGKISLIVKAKAMPHSEYVGRLDIPLQTIINEPVIHESWMPLTAEKNSGTGAPKEIQCSITFFKHPQAQPKQTMTLTQLLTNNARIGSLINRSNLGQNFPPRPETPSIKVSANFPRPRPSMNRNRFSRTIGTTEFTGTTETTGTTKTTGSTGTTETTGFTGTTEITGTTKTTGFTGTTEITGTTKTTGFTGTTGTTKTTGSTGFTGTTKTTGSIGFTGTTGTKITGTKTTGTKTTGTRITGTKTTGTKINGTKITGTKITGTKITGTTKTTGFTGSTGTKITGTTKTTGSTGSTGTSTISILKDSKLFIHEQKIETDDGWSDAEEDVKIVVEEKTENLKLVVEEKSEENQENQELTEENPELAEENQELSEENQELSEENQELGEENQELSEENSDHESESEGVEETHTDPESVLETNTEADLDAMLQEDLRMLQVKALEKNKNIMEVYSFEKVPIGQGVDGIVYKATFNETKLVVAIKCISKQNLSNSCLYNEINIHRRIRDRYCISLFGTHDTVDNIYIIMEMCDGGDLFQSIEDGPMEQYDAAIVMYDVLLGLLYLHKNNIAHLDIKPENIIHDTRLDIWKLADFGLAVTFVRPPNDDLFEGYLNASSGTPMYMSPERLQGRYTESADCWSCGVMTFVVVIGEEPFDRVNDYPFLAITEGKEKWELLTNLNSPLLEDFVRKLMNRDWRTRLTVEEAILHPWFIDQFGWD